jgi:hypothetical protein
MKRFLIEIINELKLVLFGKSLDILVPPILFLVLNNAFDLIVALIGSFIVSLFFTIRRIIKKENVYYAIGGLIGVIVAIGLAYINDNASNFFLPDLIGTSFLIVLTISSLVLKKPLAIWVSHITRGWDLEWFYRDDVKPAYRNVTVFWLGFFLVRFVVELYLYLYSSVDDLVVANIIMGYPVLIGVLTISYIYGITTLRKLKGPGIDEFMNQKEPPYRGQTRGF